MIHRLNDEDPLLRKPLKGIVQFSGVVKTLTNKNAIFHTFLYTFLGMFLFSAIQASGAEVAENEESRDQAGLMEEYGMFSYSTEYLKRDAQGEIFSQGDVSEEIAWMSDEELEKILQEAKEKEVWQENLSELLAGYPMEAMVEALSERDPLVTAFLIGIAKKESNWGKRVPLDENWEDCYNYWGYRAPGSLGVQNLGYGCFASPEEAIQVVGDRIATLVFEYERETPSEMIVWKCGSTCAGHSEYSVKKWISDVDMYYTKVLAMKE
jgi:hypothetical protein